MQTEANRHALMANTSRIFTPLQRASPWTSEAIFGFWPSVHDCRAAPRSPWFHVLFRIRSEAVIL